MQKNFTRKQKLWKIMKICAIQGMMAVLLWGVSIAHDNYGQLLEKKVTISIRELPLEEALTEITRLTHIKFFYSSDQIELSQTVSIDVANQSLRVTLDNLLHPHGINYRVFEKESTIILRRFPGGAPEVRKTTDLQEIKGTVKDALTNQPLAGVNVIVRGSTNGTSTDAEGKFVLQADQRDILVFSFIGYKTQELIVGDRSTIDIQLQEDVSALGEVEVNAGYWRVSDRQRTGNISRVTTDDIQGQPISNPLAALQGRVPGLDIVQQTGVPGGNYTVRIRGQNSIANGNDPLYIIDGVPFTSTTMAFDEASQSILVNGTSPLNSINPSEIESIEVLKDADATAIYGSRGANGVILITTKGGKPGETKFDIQAYQGMGNVTRKMPLLGSQPYVQMRNEAFSNDGLVPSSDNAPDLTVWNTSNYTDWQKKLIGGTASISDIQLSVSGGDRLTQFSMGTGYHRETTVFPGRNSDQRISGHFSISNITANQKL
ncbi:MAG TPA: TonB-dependent receptor plug domain-containing protein, partial [Cyclobacteriaceae bacterium]|nr:TonB-dependent receptor plug domain-containing protein [Cyclobacteriaceae bacterium]